MYEELMLHVAAIRLNSQHRGTVLLAFNGAVWGLDTVHTVCVLTTVH